MHPVHENRGNASSTRGISESSECQLARILVYPSRTLLNIIATKLGRFLADSANQEITHSGYKCQVYIVERNSPLWCLCRVLTAFSGFTYLSPFDPNYSLQFPVSFLFSVRTLAAPITKTHAARKTTELSESPQY